jgi:hypothetical protein
LGADRKYVDAALLDVERWKIHFGQVVRGGSPHSKHLAGILANGRVADPRELERRDGVGREDISPGGIYVHQDQGGVADRPFEALANGLLVLGENDLVRIVKMQNQISDSVDAVGASRLDLLNVLPGQAGQIGVSAIGVPALGRVEGMGREVSEGAIGKGQQYQ